MIKGLYIAHRIMKYNNRPVLKVEVISHNSKDKTITFQTDYPVEEITIPEQEFFLYFKKL